MKTRVVHVEVGAHTVYIGRRSGIWGNRYHIGRDGTREQVIAKHRADVLKDPALIARIKRELQGQVLGCHCKPHACHGDTYAEIADREDAPEGLLAWAGMEDRLAPPDGGALCSAEQ